MSEKTLVESLNEALSELDQRYNSTYITPDAIQALQKTIKSFNITITDWNTLIEYINATGNTVDALYKVVPNLIDYIQDNIVDWVYEELDVDKKLNMVSTTSDRKRVYSIEANGLQSITQVASAQDAIDLLAQED